MNKKRKKQKKNHKIKTPKLKKSPKKFQIIIKFSKFSKPQQ